MIYTFLWNAFLNRIYCLSLLISDVKECDLFPCADNYTCQNTVGSFECVPCEVSSDNCTTGRSKGGVHFEIHYMVLCVCMTGHSTVVITPCINCQWMCLQITNASW